MKNPEISKHFDTKEGEVTPEALLKDVVESHKDAIKEIESLNLRAEGDRISVEHSYGDKESVYKLIDQMAEELKTEGFGLVYETSGFNNKKEEEGITWRVSREF
ncbi:hypothetical protein ACFLZY_01460 [Patescibacteria group bacterium]